MYEFCQKRVFLVNVQYPLEQYVLSIVIYLISKRCLQPTGSVAIVLSKNNLENLQGEHFEFHKLDILVSKWYYTAKDRTRKKNERGLCSEWTEKT